jgi:hypothetical protein
MPAITSADRVSSPAVDQRAILNLTHGMPRPPFQQPADSLVHHAHLQPAAVCAAGHPELPGARLCLKELLIIDDGTDPVADLADHLPEVRYVQLKQRTSIGAKRNLAGRQARSAIIAHWDDDDWYGPGRLRYQAEPILSGRADLTGLENSCLLELAAGQFWVTRPALHRLMFVGDVHGGTLVYHKRLIEDGRDYQAAAT